MVFNANNMDLQRIIKMLRDVAFALSPSSKGYDEMMNILNQIKEEASHHLLTAARAWMLVKSVIENDKLLCSISFMDNLEVNKILTYLLVLKEAEKSNDLLTGTQYKFLIYRKYDYE